LDLTVHVEQILNPSLINAMICDRCEDADEAVVVTMQILDATFALCGLCARELPTGYHVA
jgi:hypothetical protein